MQIELGEVTKISAAPVFRGQAPRAEESGNVYALTIRDLISGWPLNIARLAKISVDERQKLSCLNGGEVLIPSRGNNYPARLMPTQIGSSFIYPHGQINIITPAENVVGGYITWCLNLPEVQAQISRSLTGTAIQALTKVQLLKIKIPMADLREQLVVAELQETWGETKRVGANWISLKEQEIDAACRTFIAKGRE
tara:strand:- start:297970 stop:298557 length:588 start_codon:yes stop_codon:yes gene_type:complete